MVGRGEAKDPRMRTERNAWQVSQGTRTIPRKDIGARSNPMEQTFFFFNICVGKPFPGSKDIELKIRPGPCL